MDALKELLAKNGKHGVATSADQCAGNLTQAGDGGIHAGRANGLLPAAEQERASLGASAEDRQRMASIWQLAEMGVLLLPWKSIAAAQRACGPPAVTEAPPAIHAQGARLRTRRLVIVIGAVGVITAPVAR